MTEGNPAGSPAASVASSPARSVFGMWLVVALLLGGALAATLWSSVPSEGQAPSFSLRSTGFEGGVQGPPVNFTLADYRGRTVVLDLMAVTCDACAYVNRDVMKPLWDAHGADPKFAILSIDTWADPAVDAASGSVPRAGAETDATLIGLQNRTHSPWRHALDTDGVWQKYSAITLPAVLVVAPDGRIVYHIQGDVPSLRSVELAVEASLSGSAQTVPILHLSLAGLAFVAGAASVLTPCTVGLLPAYLGMLLENVRSAPAPTRIRRTLVGGFAAAAGVALLYLLLALAFFFVGGSLRSLLPWLGPVVGVAMVAAGIMAFFGRGLPGLGRAGAAVDGRRSFFVFGFAFGLAGFGCTGPIFLPLLLAGFLDSTAMGILLFLLYAAAVALVMIVVAAVVAEGAVTRAQRVLAWTRTIQRVAGLLMAAAGLYLVVFFLRAR